MHEWISMSLCYIHEPWMSIRVFLSEWIFRHGYYNRYCMVTSIWEAIHTSALRF